MEGAGRQSWSGECGVEEKEVSLTLGGTLKRRVIPSTVIFLSGVRENLVLEMGSVREFEEIWLSVTRLGPMKRRRRRRGRERESRNGYFFLC